MARLRAWLVAPILWWARNAPAKPRLEQSAWERGKADAIEAAKDGRAFGLVTTVATCAAPTAVGFATAKLPTGLQIALIVLAGVAAYVLVPVAWAVVDTLTAPGRQRDEAREQLAQLAVEDRELSEAAQAQGQFASALRAGHFLEVVEAPSLNDDWIDRTELLLRESVGELEAARGSPQESLAARLARLEHLASEISSGARSISPSEQWEMYVGLMTSIAEGLAACIGPGIGYEHRSSARLRT